MEYVNLGRSGTKVSRLCLGMMTYGSTKWRAWVLEEEAGRPFIRRAWEADINFFDTADIYSNGVSEEILGRALRELAMPREQVVVATKVCQPMGETANERGLSRKHIRYSIDASLKRLQLDYVDLYQIHRSPKSILLDCYNRFCPIGWRFPHCTPTSAESRVCSDRRLACGIKCPAQRRNGFKNNRRCP